MIKKPFNPSKQFFVLTYLLLFFVIASSAQQPTWGFNLGSTAIDQASGTHIDVAGDVYTCGEFRGTVDFDPSAATFSRTANGNSDDFFAKYSTDGQFILCITFGGNHIDKVQSVTTDAAGNIYITGFFRGGNVDFDPSPATAILNSNGENGGDPGYGGDIFVAKYTSTGQYVWAFNVGGTLLGDNGICIKTDGAGNVYVGGYFFENIDFDPSAATTSLNGNTGTGFLAKYTSNGQFQWAFNFGEGNTNNSLFDIAVDAGSNVYMTGYFQGTNRDFDPSPATYFLSSNGNYEAYVAKYTSGGQFLFAFKIGGSGLDVSRGITLDNSGNIYIIGDFNGTNIDFDPSAATVPVSSNGAADVFIAKYSGTGQYIWAFNAGSSGSEYGWNIDTDNNSIFVTGSFAGVADFNPSAAIDNLTSNGQSDIFLARYSVSGVYDCAFNVGSSGNDYGTDLQIAGPNRFYMTGHFQGSNVDFTPTASTYLLNSNGSDDAFLVKYYWPPNTPMAAGTVVGNSICGSGIGQLTFTASSGISPFTLSYTDGVSTFLQTNVQNGVPFNVQVNPIVTTTYTVTIIQDAVRCSPPNNSPGINTTITVERPVIRTNNDTSICNNGTVQLNTTGAATYSWSPPTGLSNPLIANPVASPTVTTQYIVTGTTANGCTGKDTVSISLRPKPLITISNDTMICKNSSVQLSVSGGQTYSWTPVGTLTNPNTATPTASPAVNTIYNVTITDINTCQYVDSVEVSLRPDAIFSINPSLDICENKSTQLQAAGGDVYLWQPVAGLSQSNIANPVASPNITTTYSVTITETDCNQSQTLTTVVTVNAPPVLSVIKSNDIDCSNDRSQLAASGASRYSWTPASSLSNPMIANPVASPTSNTDYIVTGTDAKGCSDTAMISVKVLDTNKGGYFMPSAFTPNNDGLNDCFKPARWGVIQAIEFSIYNRWGELIFFTKDPSKCWDGTYKGVKQDPGVFVYMIKANTNCEKDIFKKGTLVLIR